MRGKILDKWELTEKIGSGGMGEIWVARHTLLNRQSAIKIMSVTLSRNEREVARFFQEAQITAQLRHRHIVAVEDIGRTTDGRPYLVMELLEGESLDRRLKRLGVFTPRMLHAILAPACQALEYAHAAAVIHRDIKPANMFLATEHDGEVLKILDFGLARLVGVALAGTPRLTAPSRTVGTPKYMSPEQARGQRDIDRRTDLWSLGVVAYKMLTGRDPITYEGGSQLEITNQVISSEIMAPSIHNPELSLSIDHWMSRALERNRDKRFQSATEMLTAFEEAVAEMEEEDERTELAPKPGMGGIEPVGSASMIQAPPKILTTGPVVNTGAWSVQKQVDLEPPSDASLPSAMAQSKSPGSFSVTPSAIKPEVRKIIGMAERGGRVKVKDAGSDRPAAKKRARNKRFRQMVLVATVAWVAAVAGMAIVAHFAKRGPPPAPAQSR